MIGGRNTQIMLTAKLSSGGLFLPQSNDFGFPIVNFPWLSGDIPGLQSYGICWSISLELSCFYILQLVRSDRCCTGVFDFHSTGVSTTRKLARLWFHVEFWPNVIILCWIVTPEVIFICWIESRCHYSTLTCGAMSWFQVEFWPLNMMPSLPLTTSLNATLNHDNESWCHFKFWPGVGSIFDVEFLTRVTILLSIWTRGHNSTLNYDQSTYLLPVEMRLKRFQKRAKMHWVRMVINKWKPIEYWPWMV